MHLQTGMVVNFFFVNQQRGLKNDIKCPIQTLLKYTSQKQEQKLGSWGCCLWCLIANIIQTFDEDCLQQHWHRVDIPCEAAGRPGTSRAGRGLCGGTSELLLRPLASSQRKLWWQRRRLAACCGKISMAPKPPLPHQATALFPSFCFSPSKAEMFFFFFWSRESEQRLLVFIFTSYVRYTLLHPFFDISTFYIASTKCPTAWVNDNWGNEGGGEM